MFENILWMVCSGFDQRNGKFCTCGKKLLKMNLEPGSFIEVKCNRCGTVNEYVKVLDEKDN